MSKGTLVLTIFLLASCASEPPPPLEVLSPSALNTRWKDFDRKPVMVHGWLQQTGHAACIYDDAQDARSDEDISAHDRRLAVIGIPEAEARGLFGKTVTIKGTFQYDIQRRSPDFGLCHFSGVEFSGAS
jgi:hypothetical protein